MNRRQILENIPIEKINILNPRERNRKIANEIKKNIEDVGLKRPITVSRRLDLRMAKSMIWSAVKDVWRPISPIIKPRFRRLSLMPMRKKP